MVDTTKEDAAFVKRQNELITYMNQTNEGVQDLVAQGIQNDTLKDLFMGNFFEIASARSLQAKAFERARDTGADVIDDYVLKLNEDINKNFQGVIDFFHKAMTARKKEVRTIVEPLENLNQIMYDGIDARKQEVSEIVRPLDNFGKIMVNQQLRDREAEKIKFANAKEKAKEEFMRSTRLEKILMNTSGFLGEKFQNLSNEFKKMNQGLLGTIGKTAAIILGMTLLLANFRPFQTMIARFFTSTFGPGDMNMFEYIGTNFTLFLSAGLIIARNKIKLALFGPRGFFGLIGATFRKISTGLKAVLGGGAGASRGMVLLKGALRLLSIKIIAIPSAIFFFLKNFYTEFEKSMTEGGGILMSLGKGLLFGLIYGLADTFEFLVLDPIKFIVQDVIIPIIEFIGDIFKKIFGYISDFGSYLGFGSTPEGETTLTNNAITRYFSSEPNADADELRSQRTNELRQQGMQSGIGAVYNVNNTNMDMSRGGSTTFTSGSNSSVDSDLPTTGLG